MTHQKKAGNVIGNAIFIALLLSAIFSYSPLFVDVPNDSKWYFFLFVLLTILSTNGLGKGFNMIKNIAFSNSMLLLSLIACYILFIQGLIQSAGAIGKNNPSITGTFDNTAGYALTFSLLYPSAIRFLNRGNSRLKGFHIVFFVCISYIVLFMARSRTGIIAVTTCTVLQYHQALKNKGLIITSKNFVTFLTIFLIVLLPLYLWKQDSSDGRLFIWKVSASLISQRPLFGHGFSGFHKLYMMQQGNILSQLPNSKWSYLADNVTHPLNEFLLIMVNYGILGLALTMFIIISTLKKTIQARDSLSFIIIVTIIIWALFSYPFHYSITWILISIVFVRTTKQGNTTIKNIPKTVRLMSIIATGLLVYCMKTDIEWKSASISKQNDKEFLSNYQTLFKKKKRDPLFLYNFGAELNYRGYFSNSNQILELCSEKYNDYNVQLLMADNCFMQEQYSDAIRHWRIASQMVPNRFFPLYKIMESYTMLGDSSNACYLAREITNKEVKVESSTVQEIKNVAKTILEKYSYKIQ